LLRKIKNPKVQIVIAATVLFILIYILFLAIVSHDYTLFQQVTKQIYNLVSTAFSGYTPHPLAQDPEGATDNGGGTSNRQGDETRSRNHKLRGRYYNPEETGSFGVIESLYSSAKSHNINTSRKHSRDFLKSQDVYTLHKGPRRHFPGMPAWPRRASSSKKARTAWTSAPPMSDATRSRT
jgi:hypothetical protein